MLITINNEEFDVNTKLGTTYKIEERFKKPYLKVLLGADDLKAKEQIDMIACGLPTDEATRFKKAAEEIGLGELSEILEEFIDALQYPGLTSEAIEQKKLEKIAKQKHMKESGLIS